LAAAGTPAAPVLILLDDCQWADVAVLDLVGAWSSAADDEPRYAALVAAYRPRGLTPDHPLRQIAAIGRIALGPLDPAATAAVARSAGAPDRRSAERPICAAAAGNPARAELAAAWMGDADGRVPPPPEALAARGIDLLPTDVRKLLGAAALLGREFSLDVAGALLGRGDAWTGLARAEAERRRLLVASGGPGEPRLAFRHDDLRRALAASIPEAERRRLHARASDVLARCETQDAVYAAAWHAAAAGDPGRAVPRSVAAARAAIARQAPDVAEVHLREARRHSADLAPDVALEIVEDLAAVHLAQGRPDLAEEQLAEAARIAREPVHHAQISASLARLGDSRGDHAAATVAAEAAIRGRGRRLTRVRPVLAILLAVEVLARLFAGVRHRSAGLTHRPGRAELAAEYALLARGHARAGRRLPAA
ncbi:MAG: hypothetical protein LC720_08205, partial [Actinobacteria bacterium]|nr:hypothetical protein [Actinomycetota bacterium]